MSIDAARQLLGVNIDHVATVREVRGEKYPDLTAAVRSVELGGADFITAHLREDRRHIQDADVPAIMAASGTWLNLELSLAPAMLAIGCQHQPRTVCLVPEKREELTTEGGLDVVGQPERVAAAVARLVEVGSEVSLFIDPEPTQVAAARASGAQAIELHTGAYANVTGSAADTEFAKLAAAAKQGLELGLTVNLGHGLTLDNVGRVAAIPRTTEFNIGHSIVARAVFIGLTAAVAEMRTAIGL